MSEKKDLVNKKEDNQNLELPGADGSSKKVGYTIIDWKQFWYDDGEVKGISLRAMVGAGLYGRMDHAVRALENSGLEFSPVKGKTPGGGRPSRDCILSLYNAKVFCLIAQTDMAKKIRAVFIECEEDIMKMAEGTAEEKERLRKRSESIAVRRNPLKCRSSWQLLGSRNRSRKSKSNKTRWHDSNKHSRRN